MGHPMGATDLKATIQLFLLGFFAPMVRSYGRPVDFGRNRLLRGHIVC
jgi:hypothetical protein